MTSSQLSCLSHDHLLRDERDSYSREANVSPDVNVLNLVFDKSDSIFDLERRKSARKSRRDSDTRSHSSDKGTPKYESEDHSDTRSHSSNKGTPRYESEDVSDKRSHSSDKGTPRYESDDDLDDVPLSRRDSDTRSHSSNKGTPRYESEDVSDKRSHSSDKGTPRYESDDDLDDVPLSRRDSDTRSHSSNKGTPKYESEDDLDDVSLSKRVKQHKTTSRNKNDEINLWSPKSNDEEEDYNNENSCGEDNFDNDGNSDDAEDMCGDEEYEDAEDWEYEDGDEEWDDDSDWESLDSSDSDEDDEDNSQLLEKYHKYEDVWSDEPSDESEDLKFHLNFERRRRIEEVPEFQPLPKDYIPFGYGMYLCRQRDLEHRRLRMTSHESSDTDTRSVVSSKASFRSRSSLSGGSTYVKTPPTTPVLSLSSTFEELPSDWESALSSLAGVSPRRFNRTPSPKIKKQFNNSSSGSSSEDEEDTHDRPMSPGDQNMDFCALQNYCNWTPPREQDLIGKEDFDVLPSLTLVFNPNKRPTTPAVSDLDNEGRPRSKRSVIEESPKRRRHKRRRKRDIRSSSSSSSSPVRRSRKHKRARRGKSSAESSPSVLSPKLHPPPAKALSSDSDDSSPPNSPSAKSCRKPSTPRAHRRQSSVGGTSKLRSQSAKAPSSDSDDSPPPNSSSAKSRHKPSTSHARRRRSSAGGTPKLRSRSAKAPSSDSDDSPPNSSSAKSCHKPSTSHARRRRSSAGGTPKLRSRSAKAPSSDSDDSPPPNSSSAKSCHKPSTSHARRRRSSAGGTPKLCSPPAEAPSPDSDDSFSPPNSPSTKSDTLCPKLSSPPQDAPSPETDESFSPPNSPKILEDISSPKSDPPSVVKNLKSIPESSKIIISSNQAPISAPQQIKPNQSSKKGSFISDCQNLIAKIRKSKELRSQNDNNELKSHTKSNDELLGIKLIVQGAKSNAETQNEAVVDSEMKPPIDDLHNPPEDGACSESDFVWQDSDISPGEADKTSDSPAPSEPVVKWQDIYLNKEEEEDVYWLDSDIPSYQNKLPNNDIVPLNNTVLLDCDDVPNYQYKKSEAENVSNDNAEWLDSDIPTSKPDEHWQSLYLNTCKESQPIQAPEGGCVPMQISPTTSVSPPLPPPFSPPPPPIDDRPPLLSVGCKPPLVQHKPPLLPQPFVLNTPWSANPGDLLRWQFSAAYQKNMDLIKPQHNTPNVPSYQGGNYLNIVPNTACVLANMPAVQSNYYNNVPWPPATKVGANLPQIQVQKDNSLVIRAPISIVIPENPVFSFQPSEPSNDLVMLASQTKISTPKSINAVQIGDYFNNLGVAQDIGSPIVRTQSNDNTLRTP